MKRVPIDRRVLCDMYRKFYCNTGFRCVLGDKFSISFMYDKKNRAMVYKDPVRRRKVAIPLSAVCNSLASGGVGWCRKISSGSALLESIRFTPALLLGDVLPVSCWAEVSNDGRRVSIDSEYVLSLPSVCSGGGKMLDFRSSVSNIPGVINNLGKIDTYILSHGSSYDPRRRYMHLGMVGRGRNIRLTIMIYDILGEGYPMQYSVGSYGELYLYTGKVLEGISYYGLDRSGDISDVYLFGCNPTKSMVLENRQYRGESVLIFM